MGKNVFRFIFVLFITATTIALSYAQLIGNNESFLSQKYSKKNTEIEQQCKTCHSDLYNKSMEKNQQHMPFTNWYCNDCHLDNSNHLKDPKNNKIKLRFERKNLCRTCHVGIEEAVTKYQHDPWKKGNCEDCHAPHATDEPYLLRLDKKNLCSTCHRLMADKQDLPVKHVPFSQGDCSACHDAHASNYPAMTRLSTGMLCTTCHIKQVPSMSMPYQHGPFADNDCTYCHDPHASKGQALLSQPIPKACYQCHPEVLKEVNNKPVKHGPVKLGLCFNCHQPHGSMSPGLLPNGGCTSCHLEIAPMYNSVSKHPVDQGNLTCNDCHGKHGSSYENLLDQKGNNLCEKCHSSLVESTKVSKHNLVQGDKPTGDCLNCHLVHYSNEKKLLPLPQKDICNKCHKEEDLRDMDNSHGPALELGKIICLSCHDPHGQGNFQNLLRQEGNNLCMLCHENIFKGMIPQ